MFSHLAFPGAVEHTEVALRTIPTRLYRWGTAPTVRTKELVGPIPHDKRWIPKSVTESAPNSEKVHGIERDPTETKFRQAPELNNEEKRKIIAKVSEVAVRSLFSSHIYKYGRQFYKQVKGGPIGLCLTGIVTRLTMDRWARTFLQ